MFGTALTPELERINQETTPPHSSIHEFVEKFLNQRRDLLKLLYSLPTASWERTGIHKVEGHVSFKKLVRRIAEQDKKILDKLNQVCEKELNSEYEFNIINILENPQLAEGDRVLATPTLIKELPDPVKRIIGDISNTEKVLVGLDLNK